jgi:hypothetical protein
MNSVQIGQPANNRQTATFLSVLTCIHMYIVESQFFLMRNAFGSTAVSSNLVAAGARAEMLSTCMGNVT